MPGSCHQSHVNLEERGVSLALVLSHLHVVAQPTHYYSPTSRIRLPWDDCTQTDALYSFIAACSVSAAFCTLGSHRRTCLSYIHPAVSFASVDCCVSPEGYPVYSLYRLTLDSLGVVVKMRNNSTTAVAQLGRSPGHIFRVIFYLQRGQPLCVPTGSLYLCRYLHVTAWLFLVFALTSHALGALIPYHVRGTEQPGLLVNGDGQRGHSGKLQISPHRHIPPHRSPKRSNASCNLYGTQVIRPPIDVSTAPSVSLRSVPPRGRPFFLVLGVRRHRRHWRSHGCSSVFASGEVICFLAL